MASRIRHVLDSLEARLGSSRVLAATCLAIVAIALGARLALMAVLGYPPVIEFYELENLARNLAQTGTLGNPYALPTGPSAHHAPVYPALLAGIFVLFGYGASAAWVQVLMNFTFASLQYALLPVLARVARLPALPAVAAALVGAAMPFRILKESRWEATLVALAMVIGVTLAIWWRREARPSYRRSAAVGAAWGLLLLASPAMLPAFLLLVAWWALPGLLERTSPIPRLAVLLLAAVVVLLPWTIRNYRALGGFVFVRSNFGLEFGVSNHSRAYVTQNDNILIGFPDNYFRRNHPFSNAAHAARVQQVGEIAYNRERLAQALAWCRDHPGHFARLTLGRFAHFWMMPTGTQPWKDLMLQPIMLLGFAGVVVVWRRNRDAGAAFAAVLLGYPLVYYFVQVDPRYRYPMEWIPLLLAAYAVALVTARIVARYVPRPVPAAALPSAGEREMAPSA